MRSKSKLPYIAVILSLLTVSCSGKATRPDGQESSAVIPLAGDFKVHRYVLDNGLRLLVVEDHSSPTFAYQTWFKVGSRDEVPGRTGLAHLFEHMMFKETKNLKDGEFDKILEGAGAEGENAFTSRDYTAYVVEMPSDKLELTMRLESDRMVNLIVDEKAFKTETEVVQNERRFRTENNPDGLMYQEVFETAFDKHPYHWPVVGYQKDLDSMSAEDARAFYRAYYAPNHATIIVSGDVKADEVHSMVKKYYGKLSAQPALEKAIERDPVLTAPRRKRLQFNTQVEKLLMAYRIPGLVEADIPALDVLQGVLTGGKSSRIYRALVETGIASVADSYDIDDKDPTLFIFLANLQKGKKATQAEQVILREIARVSKQPPSAAEMERAKNRIKFGFYEGLESNSARARFLGHYEALAGDFTFGLDLFKKVLDVTPAQVQAAAKRYLDPKRRTVIMGVSK